MRLFLLLCLLLNLSNVVAEDKKDPAAEELKRFQGTWQLIKAEADGKVMAPEVADKIRVTIKGNKHTVTFGTDTLAKDITFRVDPTRKPSEVTDTLPDGKEIKGIYRLEGDMLTSCVGGVDKERPKEFSGKEGSGQTLRVFRRVKP